MSYWDVWKKNVGVVREVHVTKLQTTTLNPPNPGQLKTLSREQAQATPGQLQAWSKGAPITTPGQMTQIAQRKVTTIALVATVGMAPIIGLIGLLAPRRVVKKDLQVSNFGPNAPGQPAKGAIAGRRKFDPYGDFNFVVEIQGVAVGAFQKVDGLNVDIDMIEYKDSVDPHPRKRPGIYRFGNIKLTKGVIENATLWEWCQRIMAGNIDRRNGSIRILNDTGDKTKPDVSYDFFQAWPCKWSGLRIDGKGGATLVEELELAIDHFTKGK
ncbi:MAG: phage tail protein [Deltaproteobacteria bacterium]|nr:MAG: phage tail protein [Deltaproteobacteria bacterium]